MTNVTHKFGTEEALEEMPITPGSIYFITDTQKIYFDTPSGKRIQMSPSSQGGFEIITDEQIRNLFVE